VQNFTRLNLFIRKLGHRAPRILKKPLVKAWVPIEKLDIKWQSRWAQIHPKPIFILGNQKAGTSAIAMLLAEMTARTVSIDLINENLYKHQSYPRVHRGEVPFSKFLAMNRLSFSREIVKEANLTIFYDELVAHFPQSKFVFILRDPRDNIKSQLNIMGLLGDLPQLRTKQLKNIRRGWDIIIDGRWLGLKGENYIEMLAARWNLILDMYLSHRETMILIRYEDFVKNKVDTIASLARALGLPQVNNIEAKVNLQFQPRGVHDIEWATFFGQDNLSRIEHICGDRMEQMQYSIHKSSKVRSTAAPDIPQKSTS
jgi:hypothetical protein